ncbi:transcriptional regulator, partial [Vibrio cholerae]
LVQLGHAVIELAKDRTVANKEPRI